MLSKNKNAIRWEIGKIIKESETGFSIEIKTSTCFMHCNAGKCVTKWLIWYYCQGKCLNFGHGKLGKAMEKVMESHGILKSSKSMNPVCVLGWLKSEAYHRFLPIEINFWVNGLIFLELLILLSFLNRCFHVGYLIFIWNAELNLFSLQHFLVQHWILWYTSLCTLTMVCQLYQV